MVKIIKGTSDYKIRTAVTNLQPTLAANVDPDKIRPIVKLDFDHYAKLWSPNDIWRIASSAWTLDVSIDCIYDHIIRFMRHIVKNYPDGYIGFMSVREVCDWAGWPLADRYTWPTFVMESSTDYSYDNRPHDGFINFTIAREQTIKTALEQIPEPSDNPDNDIVVFRKYFCEIPRSIVLDTARPHCWVHQQLPIM